MLNFCELSMSFLFYICSMVCPRQFFIESDAEVFCTVSPSNRGDVDVDAFRPCVAFPGEQDGLTFFLI